MCGFGVRLLSWFNWFAGLGLIVASCWLGFDWIFVSCLGFSLIVLVMFGCGCLAGMFRLLVFCEFW